MPWNCTIIAISGSLLSYLLKLAAVDKKPSKSPIRGPQAKMGSGFFDFDPARGSGFAEESKLRFC